MTNRKWCYVQPPRIYDIAPCKCGNNDTQWSEYSDHIWCNKCEIDFIPEHNGIFDGPILVKTAELLGIKFDRIDLETQELIPFNFDELEYLQNVKMSWNEFLRPDERENDENI